MVDNPAILRRGRSDPAEVHEFVTAGTQKTWTEASKPLALRANEDGNVVITDANGDEATYAMTAGEVLPFRPLTIEDTTTADVHVWW